MMKPKCDVTKNEQSEVKIKNVEAGKFVTYHSMGKSITFLHGL